MNYRFVTAQLRQNPVVHAVSQLCKWRLPAPRCASVWPGIFDRIPDGPYGGDFAEICRGEAHALWEKHTSLTVLWSGGNDSTLVACLLAESRPDGSTLVLMAQDETVQATESGVLKCLREMGCSVVPLSREGMLSAVQGGGMLVTGWHADVLLAGDIIRYNDLYESIWHMSVEDVFLKVTGFSAGLVRRYLSDIEPLLAEMPLPRTTVNVIWWLDFTCAWMLGEIAIMKTFNIGRPGVAYVNFFGAESLQRWSIQDAAVKIGKTRETHKKVYRDLIAEIIGHLPDIPLKNYPGPDYYRGALDMSKLIAIKEDYSMVFST